LLGPVILHRLRGGPAPGWQHRDDHAGALGGLCRRRYHSGLPARRTHQHDDRRRAQQQHQQQQQQLVLRGRRKWSQQLALGQAAATAALASTLTSSSCSSWPNQPASHQAVRALLPVCLPHASCSFPSYPCLALARASPVRTGFAQVLGHAAAHLAKPDKPNLTQAPRGHHPKRPVRPGMGRPHRRSKIPGRPHSLWSPARARWAAPPTRLPPAATRSSQRGEK
jgi:hypothetical protein